MLTFPSILPVLLIQATTAGACSAAGCLSVAQVDPGLRTLGQNTMQVVLTNHSSDTLLVLMSIRTESPFRGSQRGHYKLIAGRETMTWTEQYRVANRAYRVLRVFVGIAEAVPSEEVPYPWFAGEHQTWRFVLSPGLGSRDDTTTAEDHEAWSRYWDFGTSIKDLATRIRLAADPLALETESTRDALRRLLRWDRPVSESVQPQFVDGDSIGPYRLQNWRIPGEAGPIEFLIIRRGESGGPLPTVVYLTGNPPGTKESGIIPGMILADAGLQVVAIDRRESARETEAGEFLANIADPVYDARRVVDHLVTRTDVAGNDVSVFGFSMGAFEGMFLAALHPSVSAAVLASRMIDHDALFASTAWAPTLWSPEVLTDVGLGSQIGDWEAFWEALDALGPDVGPKAEASYRTRYPFFDEINPRAVLPLVAPRPLLVIAGALDSQFPLEGVLAVDQELRDRYGELGVRAASALHIDAQAGHGLSAVSIEMGAEWLRLWAQRIGD